MIIREGSLQLNPGIRSAVTVGKFDGLHKGHRLLIERIVAEKENGLLPVVVSVEERSDHARLLLPEETEEVLSGLGVEAHLRLFLDDEIRSMDPETFIETFLVRMLHTGFIALGEDFSFGRDRKGNAEVLKSAGKRFGFETEVFPRITEEGEVISSKEIRNGIMQGDVEKASGMLGRAYAIRGTVLSGKGFGRTLGFPTANLPFPAKKTVPRYGVYFAEVLMDQRCRAAIVNVGVEPTFGRLPEPIMEVFLLYESGDYYGKEMEVRLLRFHRPEICFSSQEELQKQISSDVLAARNFFEKGH